MKAMFRRAGSPDPAEIRVLLLVLLSALLCGTTVMAQPQQSENFRITKSVLDAGGGASSSTNFQLVSAFGQPTPMGVQASESFQLSAGFLSPAFAVAPLSPIQRLVIKFLSPDNRLHWERIAGATEYTVYRDTDPLFIPGPTNEIGTTADTFYVDVNALSLPLAKYFYNVTSTGGALPAAAAIGSPPPEVTAPAKRSAPAGARTSRR